jgi:ATP-dependent 26S proteasome regulatory subunit
MNILVYVNSADDSMKRFIDMISTLSTKENGTIIYPTLNDLTTQLRQPKDEQTVIVLFAATRKELVDILLIRDFLQDRKLIIILPDREQDTIAKGYSLHPRFLTFADSDFGDTVAIIDKMNMRFEPL